jgi:L-arabinonolactonase
VVAAFADGFALLDLLTGERNDIARVDADKPTVRMNDGRTDRQGRFIVGGMDEPEQKPIASVFRLDPDLSVHRLFEEVGCANGTCFSADGRTMWFADSAKAEIEAFDYDIATGTPSSRRQIARISGVPDGSCIDSEGYVWNVVWEGYRVDRYAPDGRLDRTVELPVKKVTCCAFGGNDLSTLFITTSRYARREARQTNDVSVQDDSSGIRAAAPISPSCPQYDLDQRLHYRHIFKVEEGEALSERLRFMLALQSQTQSRVDAPQPIFQPQQAVFGVEGFTMCHADFHCSVAGLGPCLGDLF